MKIARDGNSMKFAIYFLKSHVQCLLIVPRNFYGLYFISLPLRLWIKSTFSYTLLWTSSSSSCEHSWPPLRLKKKKTFLLPRTVELIERLEQKPRTLFFLCTEDYKKKKKLNYIHEIVKGVLHFENILLEGKTVFVYLFIFFDKKKFNLSVYRKYGRLENDVIEKNEEHYFMNGWLLILIRRKPLLVEIVLF